MRITRLCLFNTDKRLLLSITILYIFLIIAAIPKTLNYQGKLLDSSGMGLNGNYTMIFSLYTSESGGSPIWSETITNITVNRGLFSVELGASNAFDTSVDFSETYWLQLEIEAVKRNIIQFW